MREAEFREWLASQGQAQSSISTRISDLRRIEREFGDLDSHNPDELDAIAAKLTVSPEGQNQSPFTIEGNLADGLSTLRSALSTYRRFQSGTPLIKRNQADQIRDFVVKEFVEPARVSGKSQFQVTSGDVHTKMGLENAMPNVCSALESGKFAELAGVTLASREGPHRSSTVRYTFQFKEVADWAEAELRRRYGAPIVDNDKMVAFNLADGRQVALQRDVAGKQLWIEDDQGRPPAPVEQARHYLADQSRHSNLPPRLKHQPPRGVGSRRVAVLSVKSPEMLQATLDWYEGAGMQLNRGALEKLRQLFKEQFPDFEDFEQTSSSFHHQEDVYKRTLGSKINAAINASPQDAGRLVLDLVSDRSTNLLGYYKTYDHLSAVRVANPGKLEAATGALVRSTDAPGSAAQTFLETAWPLISAGQEGSMPYGDSRILPTLILALVRPDEAIALRYQPFNNASLMLLGRPGFANAPLSAQENEAMIAMARAIERIMRDEWGWKPRDLWDVQGFIWVTCQKRLTRDDLDLSALEATGERSVEPTNLILFGPPGTGKTYATAQEALRLCAEAIPDNREELMAAYRRLAEEGRIEFVTFHQSYAYEEFVEGLRPVQQEEHSAGFHLEAEAGVLRRVARRAETSTGSGGPAFMIGDRQVFKMSIGEAANPDDAHLFEEAIAGGYTLLGFEDIDWSDDQFANRSAIIEAVKEHGVMEGGEPNAMSGRVQMPFIFRNWVKPGDIIVVSKGNSLVRAIGEVTGEYQFVPREGGDYGHRRAVRWLWVDRTGVPVSEIYSRNFTMKSIYLLTRADLNVPALERYIASQQTAGTGAPQSFVLIIDEINRANVSKVMGELITLLEPDKRIGATNELRIRLPYSRELFGLPSNLHIIGTMNTADRSIALLDTALRRRFKFREVAPEPQLLDEAETATGLPLVAFLQTINDRIEYLLDREHRIGHAYFMKCRSRGEVDATVRDAVIPLLQEYFFEDLSRVAVVLGEPRGGGFLSCRQIKDPLGEGETRDSWVVLPKFAEDAYGRCVRPDTPVHLVEPAAQAAE